MSSKELRECPICKGDVEHLIRDYEESIIKCDSCGSVWDIEQLWQLCDELAGALESVVDYYPLDDSGTVCSGPKHAYVAQQALTKYNALTKGAQV